MTYDEVIDYILKKYKLNKASVSPIAILDSRQTGLVSLLHELDYKVGAEIGVEQGLYSETICQANPGVRLYCVDPWLTYTRYENRVSQKKLDQYYMEAVARLAPYNCIIIRKSSMDALSDIVDNSLDFVYIDANHALPYVLDDICWWTNKVRSGGIVAGHDYRPEKTERLPFHVIEAIHAYTSAFKIRTWFTWQGDSCNSWMFVKV